AQLPTNNTYRNNSMFNNGFASPPPSSSSSSSSSGSTYKESASGCFSAETIFPTRKSNRVISIQN
ncbi:unnamed protein product, partial [Rotaria socialis]